MAVSGNECSILDFTNQGIRKIELIPNATPASIIYDKNAITHIENLQQYENLQQLSLAENQLTDISGLTRLCDLTVLNLPQNQISRIEGLRSLNKLVWLNLSGNEIQAIEHLQGNIQLQHLDLSENKISTLGDLAYLLHLKTLLLHGNKITTLRTAPQHLTKGLKILSVAKNEICDLNEIGYLVGHDQLQQLSIMDNTCVLIAGNIPAFDYRPFVINWCLNVEILDGYLVTTKEGLKAEWLYSQGKGRYFRPGQQVQLVEYLASACPLSVSSETEKGEDARLRRVLQQQRLHQEELMSGSDTAQTLADLSQTSENTLDKKSPGSTIRKVSSKGVEGVIRTRGDSRPNLQEHSPVTQLSSSASIPIPAAQNKASPNHAWIGVAGTECSDRPTGASGQPRRHPRDMQLQDVSSSDSESQSLLDCETRYLPLHSELSMSPLRPFDFPTERPKTAPAATDKAQSVSHHLGPHPDCERPVTAHPGSQRHKSRYEQYDSRPVKAVSQAKPSRLAANFGASVAAGPVEEPPGDMVKPTPSEQQPQAHTRKRSQSPLTRAIEMLDLDSDLDSKSSEGSNTALELKLLKALLASRKSKKESRNHREMAKSNDPDVQSSVSASLSSSPYKSQYTPEKYTSPSRRDLEKAEAPSPRRTVPTTESKGRSNAPPLSQTSATTLTDDPKFKEKTLAATKLQALWRGFKARSDDPSILKVRQEIRARRAEEHITHLRVELEKQKGLYEQEKQLRAMQLEALKYLWKQVQSLQEWKQEVVSSQEQFSQPPFMSYMGQDLAARASVEETRQFLEVLGKACGETIPFGGLLPGASPGATLANAAALRGPQLCAGSPQTTMTAPAQSSPTTNASQVASNVQASQKEVELESACKNLQQQVCQLQVVLSSMSSAVFPGAISAENDGPTTGPDSIRLSVDFDEDSLADRSPKSQPPKEVFKFTTVASTNRKPPGPGIPTAPEKLWAQSHTVNTVVLHWQSSVIICGQEQRNNSVIGYRIYVNGKPRGMVAGTQLKGLLEGINSDCTYRVTVRGVSNIGESVDSNMIIINPGSDSEGGDSPGPPDDGDDKGPRGPHSGGPHQRNQPTGDHNANSRRSSGGTPPSVSPGGPNSSGQATEGVTRTSPKAHGPMRVMRTGQTANDMQTTLFKDKSPSNDSGYWTSPTNTIGKQVRGSPSPGRPVQEPVKEEEFESKQSRRAVFERLEKLEKKLKQPLRTKETSEDSRTQTLDDTSVRRSIATILDQKRSPKSLDRLLQKDIAPTKGYALNFKAPIQSASHGESDSLRKSEDMDKKKLEINSSKIPVFVRKDGSKPSSPSSTKSEMELTYILSASGVHGQDNQDNLKDIKCQSSQPAERKISLEADKPKERRYSTGSNGSGKLSRKNSLSRRSPDIVGKHSGNESSSNNNSPSGTKELVLNIDGDKKSNAPALVPNPPGTTSPRKNSLVRRRSFKKKDHPEGADSTCTTEPPVESAGAPVKSTKSVAERLKVSVDKNEETDQPIVREKTQPRRNKDMDSSCLTETVKPTANTMSTQEETVQKHRLDDDSRGRRETRQRNESGRRASSLGAIMNRLNSGNIPKEGKVTDKPPIGKVVVTRDRTPERRSYRRRTKSEQGTITSSEDEGDGSVSGKGVREKVGEKDKTYGVHAVMRKPSKREKDPAKVKTAFTSKRANSADLSNLKALPDRPESPAPKDKKNPPNVPMQAPNSPRVRRSSSFSKALGDGATPNAILRQCISLETLKAAKNRDGNGDRVRHNSTPSGGDATSCEKPTDQRGQGDGQSSYVKPAAQLGHRRSQSHGAAHDMKALLPTAGPGPSTRAAKVQRRPSLKDDRLLTAQREEREQAHARSSASAHSNAPVTYSPKLSAKQGDASPKQRKIKLGNKAADLFAKLQMRLSSSKM